MSFAIDTGLTVTPLDLVPEWFRDFYAEGVDPFAFLPDETEAPRAKSAIVDDTQAVRFINRTRADRTKRQIIEAIETCETTDMLSEYIASETIMIDALAAYDPQMKADVEQAAEDQQAILRGAEEAAARIAKAAAQAAIHTTSHTEKTTMANPDFKKFVFKNVTFSWPRLDQPYRYNPSTEKSEPCPANAQGAGYSLAWTMPNAQAKSFFEEMKAHYEDCRTRNSKLPAFSTVFGLKKLNDEKGVETGMAQFTAKKGAMSNDGNLNKEPTVVGADHQPLADKAIWGGSEGHVRVLAFPSTNPQDKSGGVSLLLDAVVVTKAEYGGDGLGDDFGSPEEIDDLPGGDNRPAASAGAATPANAPSDAPF